MNRRLSVSTWSVHELLGNLPITGPADPPNGMASSGLPLVELPRAIAERGIHTLEICHFHLTSTDDNALSELRNSLEEAGIELWSLLIDAGNLNGPAAARDIAWIEKWIGVAGRLGARNARVIAGQSAPTPENLAVSIEALKRLAKVAGEGGTRLMTENWFATLETPGAVHELFSQLDGALDLCLDFGNWDGRADKYGDLASIARYATSCHARADFLAPHQLDEEDFRRCLQLAVDADFHGPFTLIPAGQKGDEWQSIEAAANIAREFCEHLTP